MSKIIGPSFEIPYNESFQNTNNRYNMNATQYDYMINYPMNLSVASNGAWVNNKYTEDIFMAADGNTFLNNSYLSLPPYSSLNINKNNGCTNNPKNKN